MIGMAGLAAGAMKGGMSGGTQTSGASNRSSANFYQGSRVSGPRGQWPPPWPFGEGATVAGVSPWLLVAGAAAVWLIVRKR